MRPPLLELLAAYHAGRTDHPLAPLSGRPLAWALEGGLAGVLKRCCADGDPAAVRSSAWDEILGSELAARVVAEEQAEAAEELIDACAARVGPLTLLKGIWLGHALHPEPHLRPMRDIDVMVEPGIAAEVERVLIERGYRPVRPDGEAAYRHHSHLVPYRHSVTRVVVEVHHRLFPADSTYGREPAFAPALVSRHVQADTFRGRPVRRLADAMLLAHVAAHWAGSLNVVGGAGGLVAMLDVPLAASRTDWPAFMELVSGSPATAAAALLLLSYLESRGLVSLPPSVLPALQRHEGTLDRLSRTALHALVDRRIVAGRPFGRRVFTARQFETVWTTLRAPRGAALNLLGLPWVLLPLRWRIAATPFARPLARALGVRLRDRPES